MLILHNTNTILKNNIITSNTNIKNTVLPTNILTRLKKKILNTLQTQLNHKCQQNQTIFYTNSFVMDAIFEIFKEHNLIAKETYYLRTQCMKWHRDYQYRFLFKDLYDWYKNFGDKYPEYWDLCERQLT